MLPIVCLSNIFSSKFIYEFSNNLTNSDLIIRYQGYIGAALVLGGVDNTGPHLYSIHPHGSTDKLPYVTMGSGSLAAMAVFESYWKPGMNVSNHMNFILY